MLSCRTTIEVAPSDSQGNPVGKKPPSFDGQTNLIELKIQKRKKDPIAKKSSTEILREPRVNFKLRKRQRVSKERRRDELVCGSKSQTSDKLQMYETEFRFEGSTSYRELQPCACSCQA